MCWLTPQELRKVEDDMAETARRCRERQTRLLAALHAATRDLRSNMECFDECQQRSDGTFMRDADRQESEDGWKVVEDCIASLAEHGIEVDLTFEGQEVRL